MMPLFKNPQTRTVHTSHTHTNNKYRTPARRTDVCGANRATDYILRSAVIAHSRSAVLKVTVWPSHTHPHSLTCSSVGGGGGEGRERERERKRERGVVGSVPFCFSAGVWRCDSSGTLSERDVIATPLLSPRARYICIYI